MKNHKMYEADDSLISIIRDNCNVLQSLGSFGISLGFGDKSIREVCERQGVDCYTFLAVVNFTINGYRSTDDVEKLSVPTLLKYLKASHEYFLGFELTFIRKELSEALDMDDSLAALIMKLYDEYCHDVKRHMLYEEKNLFPYVEALIEGRALPDYDIETFSKYHSQIDQKLRELKDILIKYLPSDGLSNNYLSATLYDIYNCEEWLAQHAMVEDSIFTPAIRNLERKRQQIDVTKKISKLIGTNGDDREKLSDREQDVVVALVQGMSNKEIASHLFISVNTVITHRRNIARKLQIHSPAGLTIYAIVNGLVDISNVKL